MNLLTVEVSEELPLLASVVWGTLGHDDDDGSIRLVAIPQWTEAEKGPTVQ